MCKKFNLGISFLLSANSSNGFFHLLKIPLFQTLQSEVSEWQVKADNLKQLSNKLINNYKHDDTSLIKLLLEKIMNRWSALLNRYVGLYER